MTFEAQIKAITANAAQHETRNLQASRDTLEQWAEDTADWEKANRPWTDRTGHARLGLTFVRDHPDRLTDGGRVHLVHSVFYGRFLETSHGSRFAIIGPAVASLGQQLVQDLREVWK